MQRDFPRSPFPSAYADLPPSPNWSTKMCREPVATPLRLPPHHRGVTNGRLENRQGPDRTHLAPRRAKSSAEAETTRSPAAQRRFARAAAAGTAQSRLVLLLRQHVHTRWKDGADTESDR
jgi:hypothetical protein